MGPYLVISCFMFILNLIRSRIKFFADNTMIFKVIVTLTTFSCCIDHPLQILDKLRLATENPEILGLRIKFNLYHDVLPDTLPLGGETIEPIAGPYTAQLTDQEAPSLIVMLSQCRHRPLDNITGV